MNESETLAQRVNLNIQDELYRRRITKKQAAAYLGHTAQAASRRHTGASDWPYAEVEKLASWFGMADPSELFAPRNAETPPPPEG